MYRTIPLVLLLSSCAVSELGECLKWSTQEYVVQECAGHGLSRICVDTTYYTPFCLDREEEN